jgi:hypothetical protein
MATRKKLGATAITLLVAAGCSGGGTAAPTGGETTSHDTVSGIALPREVSALPPKPAAGPVTSLASFRGLAAALAAPDLSPTSDYATAQTAKWVNERAVSRFDVLNSIFNAIGQTNYADAANVNAGAYGSMVAAVSDGSDQKQKSLELWVVDSRVTTENGVPVNVIRAWIEEEGRIIPAVVRIFQAPTRNADGSYADYGVWTINADLALDGSQYFVATAELAGDGGSIIKVHSTDGDPQNGVYESRGILHRSGTAGYGKVSFADWNQCNSNPCTPPIVTVAYAYDGDVVRLDMETQGGGSTTVYKDRNVTVDLVEQYGLFDAQGRDVAKLHRFGFPVRVQSNSSYGYYGAWQGRHQIWANGQTLAEGAVVARADRTQNQTAETYTTSKVYEGILTKHTYTDASLSDIKDVVVNAWDWQNWQLSGNGTQWMLCQMVQNQPPVCDTAFTSFSALVSDATTQVNIQGGQPMQSGQVQLSLNGTHDGFVLAGTSTPFLPQSGAWVSANAGGPIWIVYTGTGWVKKQVLSVDQNNQPTFGDGTSPYSPPDGRDFYLNNMGVSYLVRCASGVCSAQLENQAVANPGNAATLVPPGTTFTQQAWGLTPSQFQLVEDSADPRFMKLVYTVVGDQDAHQPSPPAVGDVVTAGQWNLSAQIGNQAVLFSWDYPSQQNNCPSCGVQQFLVDGQGQLVLLDDPIRLAPIDLVNGAGEHHVYSLSFDGSWVSGLPDLHRDLQAAGYLITPAIQAKAVAIPNGTVVTDAVDGTKQYLFKQLAVSEYLATTSDPGGLDVTAAQALDLSTVPTWAATALGARPSYVLKYSEGNAIP